MEAEYQFKVTDSFEPATIDSSFHLCDLLHLIKLTQLIATEIAHDGCALAGDQDWLRRVAAHIDQLLAEISTSPTSSHTARFAESERNSREPDNGFKADS